MLPGMCSVRYPFSCCEDTYILADNVIGPRGLLRDKARVLVTNTVSFVRQFDNLIYMRRGIILESGCYGEAMASQGELWRLM
jgi:ATP-binding cassette subfamily C (CFTR/MRP) protein 1